jgi:alanine racemase
MHSWTELHAETLRDNIRRLRAALPATAEIVFVVKANAYGHGLPETCRIAHAGGVRWFAVVHAPEAAQVRQVLPAANIVLLGPLRPAHVAAAIREHWTATLIDADHARALAAAVRASGLRRPLQCHAKLDTGMGRLGLAWDGACRELSALVAGAELELSGLCSHLAAGGNDPSFSRLQIRRFRQACAQFQAAGFPIAFRHLSNTGGILHHPEADFDGVRAGILLYGYAGDVAQAARPVATQPCLEWKTRVAQVKSVARGTPVSYDGTYVTATETCLATIEVGYADGFSRLLGTGGQVLIRGRRRPVVGRVTMNWTVVDAGAATDVRPDDEVVLIGRQGAEALWADEMAARRQTVAYEVLTDLRPCERRTAPSRALSAQPGAY